MSNRATLYLNQLLNEAKIEFLEHEIEQKQQQHQFYSKLGEDYQDRSVISKMRLNNTEINFVDSTGTSRRSTPSDSIFSNCASANSSSPNSPFSTQILQPAKFLNNSSNLINSCQFIPHNVLQNIQPHTTEKLLLPKENQKNNIVLFKRLQQNVENQPSNCFTASTSNVSQFLTPVTTSNINSNQNLLFLPNNNAHKNSPSSSKTVSFNIRQNRAAHNELEKNRRANLRGYLDKLKTVLPLDSDSTRDTTLLLLTRARNYLRSLKQQKDILLKQHKNEMTELLRLSQELELLKCKNTVALTKYYDLTNKTYLQKKNPVSTYNLLEKKHCNNFSKTYTYDQLKKLFGISNKKVTQNDLSFSTFNKMLITKSSLTKLDTKKTYPKTFDLYNNGLLPALPLLYPYQELILRHTTLSSH